MKLPLKWGGRDVHKISKMSHYIHFQKYTHTICSPFFTLKKVILTILKTHQSHIEIFLGDSDATYPPKCDLKNKV